MIKLLVVGAGGFVGAIARYGLAGLVQRVGGASFPYGTLAVNVLGSLLIGLLMGLVDARQALSPNARLLLIIGLLGSFTTFSTFVYETHALVRSSELFAALANVGASVVLGLLAVWAGRAAVALVFT